MENIVSMMAVRLLWRQGRSYREPPAELLPRRARGKGARRNRSQPTSRLRRLVRNPLLQHELQRDADGIAAAHEDAAIDLGVAVGDGAAQQRVRAAPEIGRAPV